MYNKPSYISGENSEFAAFTFEKRFPFIITQIKNSNTLSHKQQKAFDDLLNEIQQGIATPSRREFHTEDWPYWEAFVDQYAGKRYIEIPFYAAETYAYYQICNIMDFRHSRLDPFEQLKSEGLVNTGSFLKTTAERHVNQSDVFNESYFTILLYGSLWANSADLSQLSTDDVLRNTGLRGRLVIDDKLALTQLLNSKSYTTIDFIADNAGIELVADLFLIDYLLYTQSVERVNIHLKHYPIFVSDATTDDVFKHLRQLRSFRSEALSHFADRLQEYIHAGKLNLTSHPFWNSPLHITQLPLELKQQFEQGTLLLFKGDANYRRLFEDREWLPTTPIDYALDYLNHPCLSIRTLKSEIVLGLDDDQIKQLTNEDKNWITNGKYGLIMLQA